MSRPAIPERFVTRRHRGIHWIGYVLIFTVGLRRLTGLDEAPSIALAAGLLALFTTLYASEPLLTRRLPRYPPLYFAAQGLAVLAVSVFQEYQDAWAALFLALAMQVAALCSKKSALAWWGLFAIAVTLVLSLEFGLVSGVGRALIYILLGVFIISFDMQYARQEDAQAESALLLAELRAAARKLQEQATQAERLAAAQERNRIAQEVHDSVGQKVFAIQLLAEATCLTLEGDPAANRPRLDGQLALLQEQTQAVLGQMRQLIARWRTPDGKPPTGAEPPSKVGEPAVHFLPAADP